MLQIESGFQLSIESNQAITFGFGFGFTTVRDWLSSLISK